MPAGQSYAARAVRFSRLNPGANRQPAVRGLKLREKERAGAPRRPNRNSTRVPLLLGFALRDDLLSVLRHLSIAKAALVGCSMGGSTAIDFTLEHPEMVTALVPIGAGVSGWNDWSPESVNLFHELMGLVKKGDAKAAFELSAHYWIDGPSREASRVDAKYRERALQLCKENFSLEFFQRAETILNPPAIQRLKEIECPTMVVIGASDAQDLRKIAQHLQREIAGATMATIENAAHLPSLEHPAQFNRLLQTFLAPLR